MNNRCVTAITMPRDVRHRSRLSLSRNWLGWRAPAMPSMAPLKLQPKHTFIRFKIFPLNQEGVSDAGPQDAN